MSITSAARDRARLHRRRRLLPALGVLLVGAFLLRRATIGSPTAPSPAPRAAARPSATPQTQPTTSPPGLPVATTPTAAPRPLQVKQVANGPVLLDVPVMSQLPALPNGCEVTSLAMLLTAAGLPADKMELAREQKTDPAQPVFRQGARGNLSQIESWGDPNLAFVGNVHAKYGYGIYHGPLSKLLIAKAGARGRDLTGRDFTTLVNLVDHNQAVMIWATSTLRPTSRWVTWKGPAGPVRATFKEHAVVLVGHKADMLIINNPLTGRRESVPAKPLIAAWRQLGGQALTVAPAR